MEKDYNLDEVKGFVKVYCDPEADVDQQLKDSAWILLNELNKCPHHEESSEKKDEDEKSDNTKVQKEEKEFVEHKKGLSEKKLKKLQNKSQGNISYFDYIKKQARTIGMAGLIAMGAGAITQAEIIKKESIVIIEHLRHEVPTIDQFLNKINDFFYGKNDPEAAHIKEISKQLASPNPSEDNSPPKPINPPVITDVNPPQN